MEGGGHAKNARDFNGLNCGYEVGAGLETAAAVMLNRTNAAAIVGVEAQRVTVEADVSMGLPGLVLVGQATGALHEARERVKAALAHCGHSIAPRKQVVNLAPAELRKTSSGVDLAVAVALLAAHGICDGKKAEQCVFWAELALDGTLRPVSGALVVADMMRKEGLSRLVVAKGSGVEASLMPGISVHTANSLPEIMADLRGEKELPPFCAPDIKKEERDTLEELDMSDIRGLQAPRLALEIMVGGGHNLLLCGSPGVGKTMLARRAATLYPELDTDSALEVTKIHSIAHRCTMNRLMTRVPIRMPHHSVSPAGLLGGGQPLRPGEVSLAHRGLLFLDELPEFSRRCLEGLREPLEEGMVRLVRASGALRFPAQFQLMAAMNPCPCGYFGDIKRACRCSSAMVARYQNRVSGPFVDRMDLVLPIHAPPRDKINKMEPGETSLAIRERIVEAKRRQDRRFEGHKIRNNAEIPARTAAMDHFCKLSSEAELLLRSAARQENLSLRAQHRLRRVARSYRDLRPRPQGMELVDEEAMAVAISLRRPLPSHAR